MAVARTNGYLPTISLSALFAVSSALLGRVSFDLVSMEQLRIQTGRGGCHCLPFGKPIMLWSVALMYLTLSGHINALTPDGIALLKLKAKLNDTKMLLSNWKESDTNPCGWRGVACNHASKRVIAINLPYLGLGGTLSPSIGELKKLKRLNLHDNSLQGFIPPEIANCKELRALYLNHNQLEGEIPAGLGSLFNLMILDLSSNLLKGRIPPSIGHLERLQLLNLSTNFLTGEIPKTGVLKGFGNRSFVGNLNLCGQQIDMLCRNALGFPAVLPTSDPDVDTVSTRTSKRYSNGILIVIGVTVVMATALAGLLFFLWFCILYKKNQFNEGNKNIEEQLHPKTDAKLVMFHGDLPYTSQDIIKRIEMLSDADIIGSGGFGMVYKLVMDDNNAFAVKKIQNDGLRSDRLFERELEILGSIKHRNLVNLRGYCNSPSAKLLIYDYLPLGSLHNLLHESREAETCLNWNARLNIAIGAARGLAYLHHDCCPRIVHRDVKSSNILLDENVESHVSDFGLAKLLEDDESHVTTIVAGTFGYMAPEYLQSGRATEKSDVYSYGVVLLELLSGKQPTDPSFVAKGLNVVGWVNTLLREDRLQEIVDPSCHCSCKESMESVLEIVVSCIASTPEERPTMNQVVQMLEAEIMSPGLSDIYNSNSE
ncbi:hypothetical protein SUGI_0578490 [Cryptomeria japonica]|nr:hypothetical protein SUGI_0578490 [Cryptomeria japonica]